MTKIQEMNKLTDIIIDAIAKHGEKQNTCVAIAMAALVRSALVINAASRDMHGGHKLHDEMEEKLKQLMWFLLWSYNVKVTKDEQARNAREV